MQIGSFSDCRNAGTSRNGTMQSSISALKIPVSEVDQGSDAAVRTANISTVSRQAAGLRRRRSNISPVVSRRSGLLDGGRYALVHTRSLEFDDLRPYVPGDDVRDIDWKATARSGHVLIKRFVSEKHHKILVIADAGRNTIAQAPSGERKRDIAAHVIGAIGLITLRRSDEIGMVFGDVRGCVDIRLRRGETHIESMLHRFHHHTTTAPAPSRVLTQLNWVARHYWRPLLIIVVSDDP